jgi:putative endonuclease
MDKHYVYILECKDGTYYTGYTNDLDKRIKAHQEGKGAKYTRGRAPVKLLFEKGYETKSEALKAEYRIKSLSRLEKEGLIGGKESN